MVDLAFPATGKRLNAFVVTARKTGKAALEPRGGESRPAKNLGAPYGALFFFAKAVRA
jgi:hypothetical protein